MNINKSNIHNSSRDRFILSKGHASAVLYCVLYKKGIISKEKLNTFGLDNGLCEHPEITENGIEMTTGSLGHGLAFGVGIAYSIKNNGGKNRVFVLMSDGESGEGSVWEAAILGGRLMLSNLTVIIDYNKWQAFGRSDEITNLPDLLEKWRVFGWDVLEVDGHNISSLQKTINAKDKSKPTAIIAHTISGKGISAIEDTLQAHYKAFSKEEYLRAKQEIQK